jgi:hypothetical protein
MKKNNMQTTSTIAKVFDTVLSIPGMNDNVKIQLTIPRKNVLLLSKVIERGISFKDFNEENSIIDTASNETFDELRKVANELLTKAGLMEMNEKLNALK